MKSSFCAIVAVLSLSSPASGEDLNLRKELSAQGRSKNSLQRRDFCLTQEGLDRVTAYLDQLDGGGSAGPWLQQNTGYDNFFDYNETYKGEDDHVSYARRQYSQTVGRRNALALHQIYKGLFDNIIGNTRCYPDYSAESEGSEAAIYSVSSELTPILSTSVEMTNDEEDILDLGMGIEISETKLRAKYHIPTSTTETQELYDMLERFVAANSVEKFKSPFMIVAKLACFSGTCGFEDDKKVKHYAFKVTKQQALMFDDQLDSLVDRYITYNHQEPPPPDKVKVRGTDGVPQWVHRGNVIASIRQKKPPAMDDGLSVETEG